MISNEIMQTKQKMKEYKLSPNMIAVAVSKDPAETRPVSEMDEGFVMKKPLLQAMQPTIDTVEMGQQKQTVSNLEGSMKLGDLIQEEAS